MAPAKALWPPTAGSNATTPASSSMPWFLIRRCIARSPSLSHHIPPSIPLLPRPPPFISLLWANPWAPALRCNQPLPIPASKLSSPKLLSQVSAKPLTITPGCAGRRSSEKHSSRPSVGRFSIAANRSRDSMPPKSRRKNPWPPEPSPSFSSVTKKTSPSPAATRKGSTPPPAAPNSSGSSPARFTPRPSAFSPWNFAAASSPSSRRWLLLRIPTPSRLGLVFSLSQERERAAFAALELGDSLESEFSPLWICFLFSIFHSLYGLCAFWILRVLCVNSFSSSFRRPPRFPFRAQTAHRLAQTHRQRRDGFHALPSALRKLVVVSSTDFGEQ